MKVIQIPGSNLLDFSVWYPQDAEDAAPVVHAGVKEWEVDGSRLKQGQIAEINPPHVGARIRFFVLGAKLTPQGKKAINGHMILE